MGSSSLPNSFTLGFEPENRNPKFENSKTENLSPKPETPNPKNPKTENRNHTINPKCEY
jgi:hypothetical protein